MNEKNSANTHQIRIVRLSLDMYVSLKFHKKCNENHRQVKDCSFMPLLFIFDHTQFL